LPQGKKKSPVRAYFVCEYRTDGGAVIDSTQYIVLHDVITRRRRMAMVKPGRM